MAKLCSICHINSAWIWPECNECTDKRVAKICLLDKFRPTENRRCQICEDETAVPGYDSCLYCTSIPEEMQLLSILEKSFAFAGYRTNAEVWKCKHCLKFVCVDLKPPSQRVVYLLQTARNHLKYMCS